MINWICAYCGKNTSDVDYDYLVGTNHLVCVMQSDNKTFPKKKKRLEITNWAKLAGNKFDVMGASFFISDTSHVSNVYTAWIHPWNDREAFARVTLFSNDMHLQIKVLPPANYGSTMIPIELTTTLTKVHLSNPSIFIQTIAEGLTDDPTVRDILSFVGRKQDSVKFRSGGASSSGLSGSSGNNLW